MKNIWTEETILPQEIQKFIVTNFSVCESKQKNPAFRLQIRNKKDGINLGLVILYLEIFYFWNLAVNRNLTKELNHSKLLD